MKYFITLVLLYVFTVLAVAMGLSPLLLPRVPALVPAPVAYALVAPHQYPNVIMEVMDPSLESFAPAWKIEIGRRFPDAVGVLCHGGDFIEGQWLTSNKNYQHLTTAKEVVLHYQAMFPGRTVVLLACNTGHLKLGIPGVYYAHSSVWCVPDRAYVPGNPDDNLMLRDTASWLFPSLADVEKTRWERDPDVVGNIWEFQCE